MADIAFRSFSQADQHAVTSTDPGKPTGAASTDILIAVYAVGAGNNNAFTLSAPAGWTAIHAQQTITNGTAEQICMRNWWALGNVASTSFSHNAGAGRDSGIVILAFQNVDNTTPIDATGTASNVLNTGALTVNAVTTVTDRALEVVGLADWQSLTFAMTNFTVKENGTPPPSNESSGASYKNSVTTPAGSTGTASFTTSSETSGQIKIALPFALKPATVAAGYAPQTPFPGLGQEFLAQ